MNTIEPLIQQIDRELDQQPTLPVTTRALLRNVQEALYLNAALERSLLRGDAVLVRLPTDAELHDAPGTGVVLAADRSQVEAADIIEAGAALNDIVE